LVIDPFVFPHTTTVPSCLIPTACVEDADTDTHGLLLNAKGKFAAQLCAPHPRKLPSALNTNTPSPPAATATALTKLFEPRFVNSPGTFVTPAGKPHTATVPSDFNPTP
jgi:hypothetical protein